MVRRERKKERSFYEVLGVNRRATQQEVRSAYQDLVSALHPDKLGGTPEANAAFAEVTGAYAVLRDERRRKFYDREYFLTLKRCIECSGEGRIKKQLGFAAHKWTACKHCGGSGAAKEEADNEKT